MSTTEEIDRYILKKYEVHQRLGKGVSPPCNNLQRPSLRAGRPTTLYKWKRHSRRGAQLPGRPVQSSMRTGIHASHLLCKRVTLMAVHKIP